MTEDEIYNTNLCVLLAQRTKDEIAYSIVIKCIAALDANEWKELEEMAERTLNWQES